MRVVTKAPLARLSWLTRRRRATASAMAVALLSRAAPAWSFSPPSLALSLRPMSMTEKVVVLLGMSAGRV